jgi:hypothetical protein
LLDITSGPRPPSADSTPNELASPTQLLECFEELDRAYPNPQSFAEDSRRLAEDGWMIARVTERRAQQSIIARILSAPEPRFDVTYERLVRHPGIGTET